jgi:hypothetical protein
MATFRLPEDASNQTRQLPASEKFLGAGGRGESTNPLQQLSDVGSSIPPQNTDSLLLPPPLDAKRLGLGHTYTRSRSTSHMRTPERKGDSGKHAEIELDAVLRRLELFDERLHILETENQGLRDEVARLENLISTSHKSILKLDDLEDSDLGRRVAKLEEDNLQLFEKLSTFKPAFERSVMEGRDPKMEPPPEFSGKQADFSLFSTRLAAFLAAQPRTYADDISRIMYTASRLTGVAAEWFQSYLDKNCDGDLNWADFRAEFDAEFKDPLVKQRAQNELLNLRQTQFEPFEDYLLRFRRIRAQSQLPDEAVVQHFRHGLNYALKATLLESTDYDPSDLEATIVKARQVALRQALLRAERGKTQVGGSVPQRPNMRKWCTLHNTSTHSTDECKVLLARKGVGEKSKQAGNAMALGGQDASLRA